MSPAMSPAYAVTCSHHGCLYSGNDYIKARKVFDFAVASSLPGETVTLNVLQDSIWQNVLTHKEPAETIPIT